MEHNFRDSLKFSHATSDLAFWDDVYEQAFPGAVVIDHRQSGDHQLAGIDRSLTLPSSKQITIDEKVRRTKYGDILLEYFSDYTRRAPGWVCKPLLADYIAYAILPLGRCYFLPVQQLQQAWKTRGFAWMEKFGERRSENRSNDRVWTTVSVPVPVDEVFQAMGQSLRISFAPPDDAPILNTGTQNATD